MPVHEIASLTCSCPTCEELQKLRQKNEAAYRTAHKQFLTALRTADRASLPDLEEELKQTSASRKIIAYTMQAHQAKQHSQPLAA